MSNPFVVLGIAPTYDFIRVKDAYINRMLPLQQALQHAETPQKSAAMKVAIDELAAQFALINSPENLAFYLNMQKTNPENIPDLSGYTPVFMTVRLTDSTKSSDQPCFTLPQLKQGFGNHAPDFIKNFDFNELAQVLTPHNKRFVNQIGTTEDEAIEIVNLHSHYYYSLVVELRLPTIAIQPRATEKEKGIAGPAAGSYYHWIDPRTKIQPEHIVSVRPLSRDEYTGTIRMDTYLLNQANTIWPKRLTNIINKPVLVSAPALNLQFIEAPPVDKEVQLPDDNSRKLIDF